MISITRNLRALGSFHHFRAFSSNKTSYHTFLSSAQISVLPSPRNCIFHQEDTLRRWSFQANSSSESAQARPSFLPWGLVGLCLGAYAFVNKNTWTGSASCEENSSNHLVLALRKENENEKLTLNGLEKKIPLEIDPTATTQNNPTQVWYKVNLPNFRHSPFRVSIEEGQLLWAAFDMVLVNETDENGNYRDDIAPIAQLYKNEFRSHRAILVNTGIHGEANGEISYAPDCTEFVRGDIEVFLEGNFAAVHIISEEMHPYTHKYETTKAMDILDAWCYSAKTDRKKGFAGVKKTSEAASQETRRARCRCGGKSFLTFEDILASFKLLGYKAEITKDEKIVYLPTEQGFQEVREKLKEHSKCYILGDGGRGKSRLSLEIEQSTRDEYVDTVRIALRTSDGWLDFMKHARKMTEEDGKRPTNEKKIEKFTSLKDEEVLEEYFSKLGAAARKAGKKCLVVVDNVDNLAQNEKLSQVHSAIKSCESKEDQGNLFQLLVTGRVFLKNEFDKDQEVVSIVTYWNDTSRWELFSKNFLNGCNRKVEAEGYIEAQANSKMLRAQFEKFGNITAFILTIAKLVAQAYNENPARANEVLETLASRICGIQQKRLSNRLGDYELAYLLPTLLEVLPTENQGSKIDAEEAKCIFEILALLSTGKISQDLLRNAFLQFKNLRNEKKTNHRRIEADQNCTDILDAMEKGSLILKDLNTVEMSSNYNFLMRLMLSEEYTGEIEEKQEKINEQIKAIAAVIHQRLENTNRGHPKEVREYLKLLLGLLSYSSTDLASPVSEAIQATTQKLVIDRLLMIPYRELDREYASFFSKMPILEEGYSMSPQLVLLDTSISENHMKNQIATLIKKLKNSRKTEKGKIAKELNNSLVIAKNLGFSFDEKAVQSALLDAVSQENFDHMTGAAIKKNLKNPKCEEWFVFPEIQLSKISPEVRSQAKQWLKDNKTTLQTEKKADFSGQKFGKSLSLLILHLLNEDITLKEVDLSHNGLGSEEDIDTPPVCILLQHARYLETLNLSHNYLYQSGLVKTSENSTTIIGSLGFGKSLKTLKLDHNSITEEEITHLCEELKKLNKLEAIYLHANSFGENGLKALENLMKENTSIKFITTALPSEDSWFPTRIADRFTRGKYRGHDGTKTLRRIDGKIIHDKVKLEP